MRIALGVEYDGHEFYGWQAQEGLIAVQSSIEETLSKIAAEPIKLICAGRTDAGVHATGQVVHFDTTAVRELRAWTYGVNSSIPKTITIRWAQEVGEDFHARFSARSRQYRYIIYNNPGRSAILSSRVTWYQRPLDVERMQQGAAHLIGEHDFSSFRSSRCEAKTPVRTVEFINIIRQENFIIIDIKANAFLHHMVRNIVGMLLRIGSGSLDENVMQEVLVSKDRRAAFETAPATGLYLTQVEYPAPYVFPVTQKSLLFF